MSELIFPKDFVWGVATSSYQVEGGWDEDGRGESIWDRFSHTPGKIVDGSNGDVAIDHYHRWPEDIALMKSLGVKAYRFSTAWPRIIPGGAGPVNQRGLDFYSRLVDSLLEAGITPYLTLYHWDLPQPLQDQGGWPSRAIIQPYLDYVEVTTRCLGDRVKNWYTHNEPWCTSILSYQIGEHAPGSKNDWDSALRAAHHVLVSHGLAVPIIRANSPASKVGIALNFSPADPASPSPADARAARLHDGWFNRWFLDPLFGRRYPADMLAHYIAEGHLPPAGLTFVQDGDYEVISTPFDVLGVNYYSRAIIRDDKAADNLPPSVHRGEITDMDWEVYPDGLYGLLNRLHFEYRPPELVITENGASYGDAPDGDGAVHDARRIRYLQDHLAAAHRAIHNGVALTGYFCWSLMDNFEWANGYRQRFGLVWIDYQTQRRIPKDSAYWLRDAIQRNGLLT